MKFYLKISGRLLLLSFLHFPVQALIVKLCDLQTMANRSDIVIHGYVGDQTVTTDDLGRLITLSEIEVVDGLYGAKTGEIVTVYQVGGQKDGMVMPILGGQRYEIGQELFFFGLNVIGDVGKRIFVGYGAGQGKFDIISEDNVVEDLGNVHAIDSSRGTTIQPMPLSFPSKVLFQSELKQMIKMK